VLVGFLRFPGSDVTFFAVRNLEYKFNHGRAASKDSLEAFRLNRAAHISFNTVDMRLVSECIGFRNLTITTDVHEVVETVGGSLLNLCVHRPRSGAEILWESASRVFRIARH
jgi:hypothetical protein